MLALTQTFGKLSRAITQESDWLHPIFKETDLVINQLPGGLYGYDLAEKYRVPMVLASVIPMTRTRAFPMMGWPSVLSTAPGYNRLTYLLSEQAVWQMFRREINGWRSNVLALAKSPFFGYLGELYRKPTPVLNGFSRYVVPPPTDWGDQVHTTGYWYPEDQTWEPPDDLVRFIEAGKPPVFIGFGSMPLRDARHTTELLLAAIELAEQRAILHAGWSNLGTMPLPGNAKRIDYAPYGWLFPQMSAVVHHGGSGTTALALRAGVPSLVVPFVFDQFYWGERVAKLGVGPRPLAFRKLSAERLALGIQRATADPELCRNAAALGKKLKSEDGIAQAVAVVDSLL
jgi:UDP:flavonoid glycosyltransferase YjiC (YdhE family)